MGLPFVIFAQISRLIAGVKQDEKPLYSLILAYRLNNLHSGYIMALKRVKTGFIDDLC